MTKARGRGRADAPQRAGSPPKGGGRPAEQAQTPGRARPPPASTGPPPARTHAAGVLPRAFFGRDAETVARDLVGRHLHVRDGDVLRRCRVVETEAYVGPHDLACHARAGITPRTRVIYGPPAHVYVYFIYGMHDMLNIVTGHDGDGEAVLVRAAEDLDGAMRLDGPGRLTKALGITVARDNGEPLDEGRIWFTPGTPARRIVATPRIGVDFAGAWADAPLRFVDAESPCLSRKLA